MDNETGLYYNYFRDYDPSIGRYIESDPIGLGGGINTYGYAYQNPVANYDPDGQLVWFGVPAYIWIAGGGAATAGAACYGTNCGQALANVMEIRGGSGAASSPRPHSHHEENSALGCPLELTVMIYVML